MSGDPSHSFIIGKSWKVRFLSSKFEAYKPGDIFHPVAFLLCALTWTSGPWHSLVIFLVYVLQNRKIVNKCQGPWVDGIESLEVFITSEELTFYLYDLLYKVNSSPGQECTSLPSDEKRDPGYTFGSVNFSKP
jgi:hypothetical protein